MVDEVIWNMRLADLTRGTNRSYINRLVNGDPPFTEQEREENNIEINVNFLDATQLAADARRSLYNAFQSTGKFFTVSLDSGPVYARSKWGRTITDLLRRITKGSRMYAEVLDSQCASIVLHGIGPSVWVDKERWLPEEKGIEDVLIPSDTLRSMRNLDHFAVFCQYTPEQLYRLTHGGKRDRAWNMPLVESALAWAHNQTQSQLSYSNLFSPEKVEERYKQDLGFYGTDAVPTIDFWKFYYHEEVDGECGWRMRMVLDTPGDWEVSGRRSRSRRSRRRQMPDRNVIGKEHGEWLYDPGNRVFADSIDKLIHFQFGDLSAVAPFRYHSIRSLGWLLYSVCHLQNRLLCRYNEAVFESLLQFFRGNESDKTRVQKIDLHHYGFVPDGVSFVRPDERWQVNEVLVKDAIEMNRNRMEYSAAQYRQYQDQGTSGKEKTATQVMAEINSAMSMVGTMLTQAYRYQGYQYQEICRRFCIKNSGDPDVRQFRADALKSGVPEHMLNVERWNIEPERVMGGGNRTLQIAMADALLQMRPLLDPESQRIVDRINIAAKTENDDLAERLVPEIKTVTDSKHDAQLAAGTLMLGLPVEVKPGLNHPDYIETLLGVMAIAIKQIQMKGKVSIEDVIGLRNVGNTVATHIQILSQDQNSADKVKQYTSELGEVMKIVAELEKQVQPEQGGNGGVDPDTAAKLQGQMMMAKVKAQNAEQSHAARTAQKQISWEKEEQRKEQQHQLDLRRQMQETQLESAAKDLTTAAEIRRGDIQSIPEPESEE